MNGSQSFHTPSFGDEVFEIPVVPAPLERNNKLGDLAQSADCSTYVYTDVTMSDVSDEGTRKKARDPHEPQKPVSAYALFFRDTQAAIKGQNPDASFEEVSKIVTSMWEALDPGHKNVYKKKAEAAKREYGRALTAYRANANSNENGSPSPEKTRTTSPRNTTGKTTIPNNNAKISPSQEMSENQQPKSPETSKENANIGTPDPIRSQNEEQDKGSPDQTAGTSGETNTVQRCIREGCANVAIINADWEDEYCSNECVITHCRDVFAQWVQSNSASTESYTS